MTMCVQVDAGNLLAEDEYNPNCRLEAGASTSKCLRSGDERVNDNAGLASLHTVLVREHNRLASLLETVNPHWDEETLYQEARKMVGAEIQHITYNEFLPAILGEVLTETFQLKSKGNGYHMDYNDELPTTTLNSVGNAVLQFIPSLLPGKLELYSPVSILGLRREEALTGCDFTERREDGRAGDELHLLGPLHRPQHQHRPGAPDGPHQLQRPEGRPEHGARHQAL